MTPEQITALTAVLKLIETMSSWHIGTVLLVVVIGPWLLALILSFFQSKRFEAVVKMYESNVTLVEKYEKVGADLREVVIMNTRAMTKACDAINQNQFCPMIRLEKKAKGVIDE